MRRVRIVTDSTAEIPKTLVDELGITVIPMYVHIGSETFRDGVEIDSAEFYRRLSKGPINPTTSPPTKDEFRQQYDRLSRETNGIVSIHISSKLSRTLEMADQAAEHFLGTTRVVTIDSLQASWGLGLLVVEAARKAAAGDGLDEIVRYVRGLIPKIYLVLFVNTLEYLRRGGRIGKARALVGGLLSTRPVLVLEDGEIMPLSKARSRGRAIDRLLEFVVEFPRIESITVVQGRATPESQELLMRLNEIFPEKEIDLRTFGPALATHLGPDSVGVVVYEGA
ncbi:MAG: DegV family protein [Chloroflexota bacterium]|nr:DegV family protein [Anaerolineae bacterium]